MDIILTALKYLGFGLLAHIVLAIIFGKRIKKKWEYEAEFRDETGREYGELDIEMSKIEKEEVDYTLKVEFCFRHASVLQHQPVQVFLDELLLLEGQAEKDGYVRLGNEHLKNPVDEPLLGKVCRVVVSATEIASQPLERD